MAYLQEFATKLTQLRETMGMSQQALGDLVGVSRSAVNGYEKGKSFPVPDKLVTLARHFGVSVDYLLTGEDAFAHIVPKNYSVPSGAKADVVMHEPDPRGPDYPGKIFFIEFKADTHGNIPVPMLNFQAAANYVAGGSSQEYYQELDYLTLPPWMAKGGTYKALEVNGDSMSPTFASKDIVVCRQINRPDWRNIDDMTVCVVVSEPNGVQLKRVKVRPEAKVLRCKSDNRAHKSFTLDLEHEVLEIWRFQFKISADASNTNDQLYQKVDNMEDQLDDLRSLVESIMDVKEVKRRNSEKSPNK